MSTSRTLPAGEATALDVAYKLASLIDVVETVPAPPVPSRHTH
ncbi:MAG TPA: hypothetical protein P5102_14615 [Candidatus Competibacteraceae bacterium]|jgi:hypothetical protein|nr:hypothetical protein [Candidatus Competibacteraceae bacterium]